MPEELTYSLQSPLTRKAFFGMSAVAPVVADVPPDVPEAASVGRIDEDTFAAEEEEEEEEEGKDPLAPGTEKSERNLTVRDGTG